MNAVLCTLLPVLFLISPGNTAQSEWTVEEFPNPQVDPTSCGRFGGKKSFICDPNGILPVRTADSIDYFLNGTYHRQIVCPCSQHKCETYRKGYSIAIALVKRLKVAEGESVLNAARQFAYNLEDTYWNFGECGNNVVILYSADDNLVYTMTGAAASTKLKDEYINYVTNEHGGYFNDNQIGPGLYAMSVDYRNVLEGGYRTPKERYDNEVPRQLASHTSYTLSTLLTVVAAYCLSYKL